MRNITSFRAVYCSGLAIPNQATMAALGLLFEKVYLPNNIEFAVEFARRFRLRKSNERFKSLRIEPALTDSSDPFLGLTPDQRETAMNYMGWCIHCSIQNYELFGDVIESDAFGGSGPLKATLVEQGGPGKQNTYQVERVPLVLTGEDHDRIPSLISSGYIPVVGNLYAQELMGERPDGNIRAKELAALLAMKSIEMFFPATEPVPASVILEARDRLKDHLPHFWSAMLKLSADLKILAKDSKSSQEVSVLGAEMVDMIVLPALIDLNHKIELERKQWFRRIFGCVYKALKVVATNPPMTQDQLIRSSLLLGAEASMNLTEQMQKIETMKNEVGLTYLLELSSLTKID